MALVECNVQTVSYLPANETAEDQGEIRKRGQGMAGQGRVDAGQGKASARQGRHSTVPRRPPDSKQYSEHPSSDPRPWVGILFLGTTAHEMGE